MKRNVLVRILVFYLLAITISNIFRFHLLGLDNLEKFVPDLLENLFGFLQAIGVCLGAALSLYWLKKERAAQYSLFGSSAKWSLILVFVPLILLTILCIKNTGEINIHFYGMISAFATLIYCSFEEIGWRGYLHDKLRYLKEWQRILITGFLWYFWHLSFLHDVGLLSNLIFFGMLTLGSWGLAKVVEHTKSVLAAASFHMLINVLIMNSVIRDGLTDREKLIFLGVSLPLFIFILMIWKKGNKQRIEKARKST